MAIKGNISYKTLILNTLQNGFKINKKHRAFFIEVLMLFLSIKGRINFLQLARYGQFKEQRYRQGFEKPFDFLNFNTQLAINNTQTKRAIGIDPSFFSKSGDKTPGLGYFWSGSDNAIKRGLEFLGIALLDIAQHNSLHLEIIQNLKDKNLNFFQWILEILDNKKEVLISLSNYVVADAYFSKEPFVNGLKKLGFYLISRLRVDATLYYISDEKPSGKRGRPKLYCGKVDFNNLKTSYFSSMETDDKNTKMYTAVVYSKSFKTKIKVVIVLQTNQSQKQSHQIYFSTDIGQNEYDILEYYRTRFQMEFNFRDAKQHTGLEQFQSRSENKIYFHTNMSLTSVNIAKVVHHFSVPIAVRKNFSMADIKTFNHNSLLLKRFFIVFGISPNTIKNKKIFKELLYYGTIAA